MSAETDYIEILQNEIKTLGEERVAFKKTIELLQDEARTLRMENERLKIKCGENND